MTVVRAASPADAPAIAAIYNAGIAARQATFETRSRAPEEVAAWPAPVLVAEDDEGSVTGWARATPYSPREVYAGVLEASVYVDERVRGRGIATDLLAALAAVCAERGGWKLTGKLFANNEASVRLMRRVGYRVVGVHERHARLDGEWRDVVLVERTLD